MKQENVFTAHILPFLLLTIGAAVAAFALEEFLVPFTILGGGIAGSLISSLGYERMFVVMGDFSVLAIVIYVLFGRTHPSSFTYRKQHGML